MKMMEVKLKPPFSSFFFVPTELDAGSVAFNGFESLILELVESIMLEPALPESSVLLASLIDEEEFDEEEGLPGLESPPVEESVFGPVDGFKVGSEIGFKGPKERVPSGKT
jgi:hypothetical protein